jgi:site-specific recombinase XerD
VSDDVRLLAKDKRKKFRPAELMPGHQLRLIYRNGPLTALHQDSGHHAVIDLRDRALVDIMLFSFARVRAVIGMNVEGYFQKSKRHWFRLHEKGGRCHEVPAHHHAEAYVDAYLEAASIASDRKGPLFRSFDRRLQLVGRRMHRTEALLMIKRRARQAGLPEDICCHTFRATGITNFLQNGGTIERAQKIAAHESPRTTKLYDRTSDEPTLDDIEKIQI